MNRQIRYGLIIAYVNIVLNLVINYALIPIMLYHLGSSEYGVYRIVQSFIGQLSIMSFGLATVSARYVVLYNTQKKIKEKESFLFLIYAIGMILSLSTVVIGVAIYGCMDIIYAKSLTSTELEIAKRLVIILVFNVAFSILCDCYTGILRAYERFIVLYVVSSLRLVLRLVLIIVLLSYGVKSIGIVLTDLSITLSILVFSYCYVRYKLKERAKYYRVDKRLIAEIATFALAVFLQAMVNQINQNLDNTILGIMTSTSVVTVYSIALTLYTSFVGLVTVLSNMFGPKATVLVASGASGEQLTDFVIGPGRIQTIVAMLGLLEFLIVGKDFIKIWMGDGFDDVYTITLILIIPAIIPLIESVTNTILDAMLKRIVRSFILIGISILNVLTSIILIRLVGYIGAAFGTAISIIVGHGIIINLYLHKKIGLNIPRMFRDIFHGLLPAFSICLVIGFFISLIPGQEIFWFLLKVVLLMLEYAAIMYLIGMNKFEKQYINSMATRLCKQQ